MHPFLPQQKLFKAYDIRGDVRYFTDDFVLSLGLSFANLFTSVFKLVKENACVVVGYDVRIHSEFIAKLLAYQLSQSGIQVIWLGQVTTPMMAFMANTDIACGQGNGLIVTASHSERHINGIKWLVNHESPSSQDIADLFESLANTPAALPSQDLSTTIANYPFEITPSLGSYQQGITSALSQICQQYLSNFSPSFFKKSKIVIDCLNGATSRFAEAIFAGLGYDCILLNDTPDGTFPKGNPDPTEAGRLAELCDTVLEHHADIGLAFDGDGDRLMVVDSTGTVVAPDHLLYLLAKLAIVEKPTYPATLSPFLPAVIFDVKCSHHLPNLIAQDGGLPLMEKTGSSLMRKSLQNKSQNAIFAGELSGHFLFNDGYFVLHDDAMYAAIRLLNWLQRQPDSLAAIVAQLPVSVSTADMYLPIDTAETGQNFVQALIVKAKTSFALFQNHVIEIDENQNPILAQTNYQTTLTEFLPKPTVKKPRIFIKSKKLPFFGKPARPTYTDKATKNALATADFSHALTPKQITTIDGLRVDFEQGFGILRKSNTGNFLTVRFAGDTLCDLRNIQQVFVELCQSLDNTLAVQVAQIQPQHF